MGRLCEDDLYRLLKKIMRGERELNDVLDRFLNNEN